MGHDVLVIFRFPVELNPFFSFKIEGCLTFCLVLSVGCSLSMILRNAFGKLTHWFSFIYLDMHGSGPLSPQWLFPKSGENKTGIATGVCYQLLFHFFLLLVLLELFLFLCSFIKYLRLVKVSLVELRVCA